MRPGWGPPLRAGALITSDAFCKQHCIIRFFVSFSLLHSPVFSPPFFFPMFLPLVFFGSPLFRPRPLATFCPDLRNLPPELPPAFPSSQVARRCLPLSTTAKALSDFASSWC